MSFIKYWVVLVARIIETFQLKGDPLLTEPHLVCWLECVLSDWPDVELAEPVLALSRDEAEEEDVAEDTPEEEPEPRPENTWE